jgi:hypothetical protein
MGSLTLNDTNRVEALLDPRGILHRLEGELGRVLGVARSLFRPIQFPSDWMALLVENRPDLMWSSLFREPPPSPGQVFVVPDISELPSRTGAGIEGSLLLNGLGGSDPQWHGVVEWHSLIPGDFPPPRQSLAVLLSRVLENRLTASLRLQAMVFREPVFQHPASRIRSTGRSCWLAERRRPSASASSTSMTSRASTKGSGTRGETRSFARWPSASAALFEARTPWLATAGTSSRLSLLSP